MSSSGPVPARAPLWGGLTPAAAAASRRLFGQVAGQRTVVLYVLAVGTVNVSSLLGNGLAFRWIDPPSMGIWHTLLLLSSYLAIVRLGLVNGLGRELPFALGSGDVPLARRIVATSLAYCIASSAVAGLTFFVMWPIFWSSGLAWRLALPAMAVVTGANLYLAFLQATFRSDSDFTRLARVNWVQAAIGLLLPLMVYTLGFAGLCLHAALSALLVTGFAHALRPFHVEARFEPRLTGRLLVTGLPLFTASYLQTLALGFDRVILLHRSGVQAVGYYAPALAVMVAMAIVPGAVASYAYPRMSYALGQGRTRGALRRMALTAAGASLAAGLPVAVAGWYAAPTVIARLFPQYTASIPAVRWSLLAGLLWSLSPASSLLGSLKAWRSLSLYVGLVLVARWTFPWLLSRVYEPLDGVARGNVLAAAVVGVASLSLVHRVTRPRLEDTTATRPLEPTKGTVGAAG
jgi:O-antigen/teichoic acid export membrane protein